MSTSWNDDLIIQPAYKNSRWEASFPIKTDADLGFYSFRVRYNDSLGVWTRWLYLNNSLQVKNNLPEIDYFDLTKDRVEIGDQFEILVNGTDVEDEVIELQYFLEYKSSSGVFWDPVVYHKLIFNDRLWRYNVNITPDMEYGYYDFRVRISDKDMSSTAQNLWRSMSIARTRTA
jgi:hypothetical protein